MQGLIDACDFVAIARVISDGASSLGMLDCTVSLTDATGRALVVFGPRVDRPAEDELLRRLHEKVVPVDCAIADGGMRLHALAVPLIRSTGPAGAIVFRFRDRDALDGALRDALAKLGNHASVRLAELHITTAAFPLPHLTDKQIAVCQCVVEGLSNPQVAETLGMSANTVKKHLKDVFERLSIGKRSEIASSVGPWLPCYTELGTICVTPRRKRPFYIG